ncbi:MAG: hypothetical protein HY326_06000, partial [Chloroflexi bacterium]|nr:hypothetical protein [Chloroflexota bacterium]
MALTEIGSQKQLFVDDYLIERMTDAKQILNPAEKVGHNPVVRPDSPWEGNYMALSHVIFDQQDQIFKMWYSTASYSAHRGPDGKVVFEGPSDYDPSRICLATSTDGLHWEKPLLGLVEFQGSRQNNIVPDNNFMPYFFQDLHEEDPAKRYKGLIRTGTTKTPGMTFDLY